MASRQAFRLLSALMLASAVVLAGMYAAKLVVVPSGGFFPPSFVTHTVMLVLAFALMLLLSKGRPGVYGFTRGTYKFSARILLWALPTAVLSTASAFAPPGGHGTISFLGLTKLQVIAFVWIYASISEELLTRGFLQTQLSGNRGAGLTAPRILSLPVVVSGLFFGAMHIVLIGVIGYAAVPVSLLAAVLGLVSARYREKTGSLVPAIIVHALFNIGGTLPLWLIQWLRF
jgi:membrane protease YdiL (CAAX protease family)